MLPRRPTPGPGFGGTKPGGNNDATDAGITGPPYTPTEPKLGSAQIIFPLEVSIFKPVSSGHELDRNGVNKQFGVTAGRGTAGLYRPLSELAAKA